MAECLSDGNYRAIEEWIITIGARSQGNEEERFDGLMDDIRQPPYQGIPVDSGGSGSSPTASSGKSG